MVFTIDYQSGGLSVFKMRLFSEVQSPYDLCVGESSPHKTKTAAWCSFVGWIFRDKNFKVLDYFPYINIRFVTSHEHVVKVSIKIQFRSDIYCQRVTVR